MSHRAHRTFGRLVLGSAVLLSAILPQVANAATGRRYIESVQVAISGNVITATALHVPHIHVDYQFQAESPNGHWSILRRFAPSNRITWNPPGSGYHVRAYALTAYAVAHHQWKRTVGSVPYVIAPPPPVSSVRIVGVPSTNALPQGVPIALSAVAYDAAGTVVSDPGTAHWSVSGGAITPGSKNTAVLQAGSGHAVTVTVTVGGQTASQTFTAYPAPTSVSVQVGSSTLGVGRREFVTVQVADAAGLDTQFSGTVDIADTAPELVTPDGSLVSALSQVGRDTVAITSGVGQFFVQGGPVVGTTETLTATDLSVPSSDVVSYGSGVITVTPQPLPVPAQITGLAYSASSISGAATDVVSTDPVVTSNFGTTLPDTGTYTLAGPSGYTGVSIDSATGAITVNSGAMDGHYTITYTQGMVRENVPVIVDLPLYAPTAVTAAEVSGGIAVGWAPASSGGTAEDYQIWMLNGAPSSGNPGPYSLVETVPGNDTHVTITPASVSGGLSLGNHTMQVVAVSSGVVANSLPGTSNVATYGAVVNIFTSQSAMSGAIESIVFTMNTAIEPVIPSSDFAVTSNGSLLPSSDVTTSVSGNQITVTFPGVSSGSATYTVSATGVLDAEGNPAVIGPVPLSVLS